MRTSKTSHTSETVNILIRAAVAEADAATAALSIDPRDIVRAARGRIADMTYPTPEREHQAARIVASRAKSIDELICHSGGDLTAIRRAAGEMEEACRRLTIPEKLPSFSEEIYRTHAFFQQASWSGEEIDGLKAFFHSGDRISGITISSVKLGDREVKRSDIRTMLKGLVSNAQLDQAERQEREALQLQAQNEERRTRSLGPIHRHW